MSEPVLEEMLKELREIRNTMTTKDDLVEIRSTMATKDDLVEIRGTMATMATKDELNEIRSTMATKDELNEIRTDMNKGFADLKWMINEFHSENISADEKLLEAIMTTNTKLDHHIIKSDEQFNSHEYSIDILHRNQLKLETEIEKIKNR